MGHEIGTPLLACTAVPAQNLELNDTGRDLNLMQLQSFSLQAMAVEAWLNVGLPPTISLKNSL